MMRICQFGAGRIGQIHAANVAAHPRASLHYVVDIDDKAARALADRYGARVTDQAVALVDSSVDAVIIASATSTHAELIEASAKAGKAIFCEKPIDLDLARVDACLDVAAQTGVVLQVGFNRRFDPSIAGLHQALRDGRVGKLESLLIISRDPAPPGADYFKGSGGLFRDMMIHDFDLARWLLGEEPVELYASASCLIDPVIGELGDVDTAAVTLKTADGVLAVITNSRRAVYGYDQRIEAFGAGGLLRLGDRTATALEVADDAGVSRDKPLYFFLERYAEAYRAELDHFIVCIAGEATPQTTGEDGRQALYLAEAANQSLESGRPVALAASAGSVDHRR